MGYITRQGAINIKSYKMSATVDNSLIYNYILSPLCNQAVQYLPMWVAPNLITALGFLCLMLSAVLAIVFVGIPSSKTDAEVQYIALASAVLIFAYMFMDNMDGKQARRTKTSSPLGELIDHGCDSMTIGIGALNLGILIGADPWLLLYTSLAGAIPFYLAHWEEYFTHSLVLGMLNGPTEVECLSISVFLITYFFGISWWRQPVNLGVVTLPRNALIVYLGIAMGLYTAIMSLITGFTKARAQGIPTSRSLAQLIPFVTSLVATYIWTTTSPILVAELPLYITTFGFIFSVLVGRCIVQRICNESYRNFYPVLIPLLVATANSLCRYLLGRPFAPEHAMLLAVWGLSLLAWLHFVVSIIREMCKALNINAFSIPYKGNKASRP